MSFRLLHLPGTSQHPPWASVNASLMPTLNYPECVTSAAKMPLTLKSGTFPGQPHPNSLPLPLEVPLEVPLCVSHVKHPHLQCLSLVTFPLSACDHMTDCHVTYRHMTNCPVYDWLIFPLPSLECQLDLFLFNSPLHYPPLEFKQHIVGAQLVFE